MKKPDEVEVTDTADIAVKDISEKNEFGVQISASEKVEPDIVSPSEVSEQEKTTFESNNLQVEDPDEQVVVISTGEVKSE